MFAVFIDQVSPRIHYILEEFFLRRLGCELKIHTEKSSFEADQAAFKFQYIANQTSKEHFYTIISTPLMIETGVDRYFDPEIGHFYFNDKSAPCLLEKIASLNLPDSENLRLERLVKEPFPCLFPNDGDLGFDVFGMAFYFFSRYEEYQKFNGDDYGRFAYENSILSKWEYNTAPFVDIAFYHFLCQLGAVHLIPSMEITPSFDVDIAFRFKGRSLKRQIASTINYPQHLWGRIKVWLGAKDPFDPQETLFQFIEKNHVKNAHVFWLCSRRVKGVNRQISRRFKLFKERIQTSLKFAAIGIHPSLTSRPELVWEEEKNWLEKQLTIPVVNSRQHYVHLLFPETYKVLLKLGIKHDWSMGFAENIGFRAGTAYHFQWFDLIENHTTPLWVHPFCIMDVTAKNYMHLCPNEAIDVGRSLKELIFLFGGSFTFIAHNESLSETEGWEGWNVVFESWSREHIIVGKSLGY